MKDLLFIAKIYIHFFYCVKLVVNHASKSLSCVSKSKVNSSTYHPFINGQNHGIIYDANFGLLCYNNSFFLLRNV
jgi:hypothetical protein